MSENGNETRNETQKKTQKKAQKDAPKEYTLEENFQRLEEAIEQLEKEDIPLEEAFRTYTLGMQILKRCNDQIDRVEKQVLMLGGTGELEEFEHGETEV